MKIILLLLIFPIALCAQSPQQDSAAATSALRDIKTIEKPDTQQAAFDSPAADTGMGVYEILVRKPLLNLSVSATSNLSWDTNPAFSASNEEASTVFTQSVSARYARLFAENWLGDISLQQSFYRYDAFEYLDFDRSAVRGSITWTGAGAMENAWLKNWVPSLGFEVFRLYDANNFSDPILDNTFLTGSLQRVFQANETHRLLLGISTSISVDASVDASQRNEHALTGAWLARWAPRWESVCYARTAFYDYDSHDDWNTSAGLAVEYAPRDWCRIGLNFSASRNDSSVSAFSYENLSLGASLNIRLTF